MPEVLHEQLLKMIYSIIDINRELEMIYSIIDINREHFQLILSCKYPMKRWNKFQHCPLKNDSGVTRILEMHNRFVMNEIELFVEQVPIDL